MSKKPGGPWTGSPTELQGKPGDLSNAGTKPYTVPRSDDHPNLRRRARVTAS